MFLTSADLLVLVRAIWAVLRAVALELDFDTRHIPANEACTRLHPWAEQEDASFRGSLHVIITLGHMAFLIQAR